MFAVDDLQACSPEALTCPDGVAVVVADDLDQMGFHRVTVYGETRDDVVGFVADQWGTDDPDWYRETVAGIRTTTWHGTIRELAAEAGDWEWHDPDTVVDDRVAPGCEDARFTLFGVFGLTFRIRLGQYGESNTLEAESCPTCGSVFGIAMFALDGEADLADYWECTDCRAHGAIVHVSDPTRTQNGHPAYPSPAPSWAAYSVVESTPGYLPESDPPDGMAYGEAMAYLRDEVERYVDELADSDIVAIVEWGPDGESCHVTRPDTVAPDLGRTFELVPADGYIR